MEDGKQQSALLQQLAEKDNELEKLKEELLRLKAGSSASAAPEPVAPPAASPDSSDVSRQASNGIAPVQPKKMSVKIPYECITTKSPDGKESWPNVNRVTPPADFAERFSDMVKVGCYCWRIVDKIRFSSKGDRKQERVLAITAQFLFVCDLQANINRVLRCVDVERIVVQETDDSTFVVFKPYAQCEEHSIMLELRPDSRNPSNKPLQPIFALNYTRKPRTKNDVEVIRVAPTTDLKRHPTTGNFNKPNGYLSPHLKIQKWRETGKWPCGSTSILPTARSMSGAHKLRPKVEGEAVQRRRDLVTFRTDDGSEISLKIVGGKLLWLVDGNVRGEAITELRFSDNILEGRSADETHTATVQTPEPGPKRDALLRDMAVLSAKSKVATSGLPVPMRRMGAGTRTIDPDLKPVAGKVTPKVIPVPSPKQSPSPQSTPITSSLPVVQPPISTSPVQPVTAPSPMISTSPIISTSPVVSTSPIISTSPQVSTSPVTATSPPIATPPPQPPMSTTPDAPIVKVCCFVDKPGCALTFRKIVRKNGHRVQKKRTPKSWLWGYTEKWTKF